MAEEDKKELKTLKDLWEETEKEADWFYDLIIDEAKKWIEELEKEMDKFSGGMSDDAWAYTECRAKRDWVKHFFNLEEEGSEK